MHFSSKDLAPKESEAEHFNINLKELEPNFPPMVEGAPVAFFCQLLQEVDLKDSKTIPLIVKIKKQFIDDTIISSKESLKIDYSPIARVGKNYALLGEAIEAPKIKE
jgi:flavin reductase (DIM6/NTAB) family NADH-FMN oxidoreductase RutF